VIAAIACGPDNGSADSASSSPDVQSSPEAGQVDEFDTRTGPTSADVLNDTGTETGIADGIAHDPFDVSESDEDESASLEADSGGTEMTDAFEADGTDSGPVDLGAEDSDVGSSSDQVDWVDHIEEPESSCVGPVCYIPLRQSEYPENLDPPRDAFHCNEAGLGDGCPSGTTCGPVQEVNRRLIPVCQLAGTDLNVVNLDVSRARSLSRIALQAPPLAFSD